MGDVQQIGQILLSVSQIASEFGMARATVSKRIDALGIHAERKRAGYPVYRLRDIVRIFGDLASSEENDPMKMRPQDRRAWFQSENERLKFESEEGRLIPAGEAEAEMGEIAKIVTRALSTLPDKLERDLRVSPAVVEYVTHQCRATADELYAVMAADEMGDARASA